MANWRRRVFNPVVAGATPYDLRHAFASLRLREGTPVTDLADQLGHSPQMTLSTYAHVMRELKGTPARPAAEVGSA